MAGRSGSKSLIRPTLRMFGSPLDHLRARWPGSPSPMAGPRHPGRARSSCYAWGSRSPNRRGSRRSGGRGVSSRRCATRGPMATTNPCSASRRRTGASPPRNRARPSRSGRRSAGRPSRTPGSWRSRPTTPGAGSIPASRSAGTARPSGPTAWAIEGPRSPGRSPRARSGWSCSGRRTPWATGSRTTRPTPASSNDGSTSGPARARDVEVVNLAVSGDSPTPAIAPAPDRGRRARSRLDPLRRHGARPLARGVAPPMGHREPRGGPLRFRKRGAPRVGRRRDRRGGRVPREDPPIPPAPAGPDLRGLGRRGLEDRGADDGGDPAPGRRQGREPRVVPDAPRPGRPGTG